jgi:hypothetical protein
MSNLRIAIPLPANETVTIIGTQNLAPSGSWELPTTNICTYTASEEGLGPSAPLSEGAVRLVNSILARVIPERAILRDPNEDF